MKNTKIEIFNNAKTLFCQQGFKDTSIANITKITGIGVGTFYNFYASKEELFMDIFMEENRQLKKEVLEAVDLEGNPGEILREVMARLLSGMKRNPILKEWYNRDTFHKIMEKIDKEELEKSSEDFFYHFVLEIIEEWQKEGRMRKDIDAEYILALFNALSFVDLHKEEIGDKYFSKTMDYLVEFIVKGLQV